MAITQSRLRISESPEPTLGPLREFFPETIESARLERVIRDHLGGRPIPFKLTWDHDGCVVSAVVPTFYSKQLLLRAVQKATFPARVRDCISVPYPFGREAS